MSRFAARPWLGEGTRSNGRGSLQAKGLTKLPNGVVVTAAEAKGVATAPKTSAKAAAPARPAAARYTKGDLDQAAANARSEERARLRAVFASEHSKGRERLCATLLGSPDGWSAQEIVSRLPGMSDDRQFAAKLARKDGASDAVWDRAYATATKETPAAEQPNRAKGKATSDDVWAGAYNRAGASSGEQAK